MIRPVIKLCTLVAEELSQKLELWQGQWGLAGGRGCTRVGKCYTVSENCIEFGRINVNSSVQLNRGQVGNSELKLEN